MANFTELHANFRKDYDRDFLQINFELLVRIGKVYQNAPREANDLHLVKKLVVELRSAFLREAQLVKICRYFSGLKVLYVMERDTPATNQGIPSLYRSHEGSRRHNWNNIHRQIKAPIPLVRDQLSNWVPPILSFGSVMQWEESRPRIQKIKFEKIREGDMDCTTTVEFPSFDYIPLYQSLGPKRTYDLIIASGVEKPYNKKENPIVENFFKRRERDKKALQKIRQSASGRKKF